MGPSWVIRPPCWVAERGRTCLVTILTPSTTTRPLSGMLQAIDSKGLPIKGLYVAGADNGTLMSAPYCDYEGYSLMCAYSGGRMAGMYAAEDIEA